MNPKADANNPEADMNTPATSGPAPEPPAVEVEAACFECAAEAAAEHHVVPVSRGGTKTVPLCEACHAAVHELEKSDLHACRVREGHSAKAGKGGWLGGRTPVGFKPKAGKVVPCPFEAKVVTLILDLRDIGVSYRDIQTKLAEELLWPRGRNGNWIPPKHRTRGKWSLGAIRSVIKRAEAAK